MYTPGTLTVMIPGIEQSPVADPGFSPGGVPTPKNAIIFQFFAENCMKMKEFGPPGGARIPGTPLGSANGHCVHSCDTGCENTWNRTVTVYTPGTLAVKTPRMEQSLCSLLGHWL